MHEVDSHRGLGFKNFPKPFNTEGFQMGDFDGYRFFVRHSAIDGGVSADADSFHYQILAQLSVGG